jgi:acylphosphatase
VRARKYVVSGRVQGVGFRWFTESAAVRAGVRGWVRNLPDGRVEVAAEGDAAALEAFEREIRRGPRGARVDAIDIEDAAAADGHYSGFTIK